MRPGNILQIAIIAAAASLAITNPARAFDDYSPTDKPALHEDAATLLNLLDDSMRQHAALSRLRQHIPQRDLDQSTLAAAFDAVAEGTALDLHVDWPALQKRGLTRNTPLKLTGHALSYEQYLAAACQQAGVTLVLSFNEPGGTFTITTAESYHGAQSLPADPSQLPQHVLPITDLNAFYTPAERTVLARLDANLRDISADQRGFENTLALFQAISQTHLLVNWKALEEAGIDRNTPVTIHLRNLPNRTALTTLLANVGFGFADLGYTIEGNAVIISTREDLNSDKYVRLHTYDIRPLEIPGQQDHDDQVRNIIDTIKTAVAPESWLDAGGQTGYIRESHGFLTIKQTRDNHLAIAQLLQQIIAVAGKPPAAASANHAESDLNQLASPADRTIQARLETILPEISAQAQDFEKVLAFLQQQSNLYFYINWTALQAAGIDHNTPVTINLHQVPLRKALNTILSEIGGGSANLGYTIDGGSVIISTRDDLNSAKYQIVHIFDIRPLLPSNHPNRGDRTRDLVDIVQSYVAPETWRNNGGTIGSIRELNGTLIVSQTHDNQLALANLLQEFIARQRQLSTPQTLRADYMDADLRQLYPPADLATLHQLSANLPEFSAANQSLETVLSSLQQSTHANLLVNWTALQAAGINRTTPVTVNLQNITAAAALTSVLAKISSDTTHLAWTVDQGVTTIDTSDDLESAKYQTLHLFDISALVAWGQPGYEDRLKSLIDIIKSTTAPDSWRDFGGQIGSIRERQGYLIVNQTRDHQAAIALLLKQIAAAKVHRPN